MKYHTNLILYFHLLYSLCINFIVQLRIDSLILKNNAIEIVLDVIHSCLIILIYFMVDLFLINRIKSVDLGQVIHLVNLKL